MNMKQSYFTFLDGLKQAKQAQAELLGQKGAVDEANLIKIELNIIGVFKTVFEAMEKTGGDFSVKVDQIKVPWEKRLTAAKAHGDYETEAQEKRKLAIHGMLKSKWQELIENDNP